MLNTRVTFRRRAPMPTTDTARAGFVDFGTPVWASFKEGPSREERQGFVTFQRRNGTLTIRDNSWARRITSSDRVVIASQEYAIENVRETERVDGSIRMFVAQVPSGPVFAREVEQRGEVVVVRRLSPPTTARARAIVTGYAPDEVTGGVNQGDRKIILLHSDLVAAGFPVPVRRNDKIVLLRPDRLLNVEEVDDSTFRDAGELSVYQIRATG